MRKRGEGMGGSGGIRHGRAGPLPRAPRFEGAPWGPLWGPAALSGAPRAEPALRMGERGHTECTETFLYKYSFAKYP